MYLCYQFKLVMYDRFKIKTNQICLEYSLIKETTTKGIKYINTKVICITKSLNSNYIIIEI